jgi:hypothetical protein
MDSSVSSKEEICFMRVCHHISNAKPSQTEGFVEGDIPAPAGSRSVTNHQVASLTTEPSRHIIRFEECAKMSLVDCVWNVTAHAQKPDFVFRRKGPSPFKSAGGSQFSRLLAAEVCASAAVMLDTTCCEVVWRVLTTHSICKFPLHFPSCASPCAITFQLGPTNIIMPLSLAWTASVV